MTRLKVRLWLVLEYFRNGNFRKFWYWAGKIFQFLDGNSRVTWSWLNGNQTHQTLILLIIMFGELCLNATIKTLQRKPNTIDELKKVLQTIGMI